MEERDSYQGWRDPFADVIGKALSAVEIAADKESFVLRFTDGSRAVYLVEGDCCSYSWVEHVDVPPDALGQPILSVEEYDVETVEEHPEHDCLQVYQTRLETTKGTVALEYRNSSNGYYGGYITRVAEEYIHQLEEKP